ncbi:helix-turn-helix transcriptional regulator [Nicoliella lavandulae]|uniref:Helix-turn-helix domain-containing protein n=1 Tax=Nicoliella lavandulae TaxID=3082954 RepID=A0ABU8SM63_9LACO
MKYRMRLRDDVNLTGLIFEHGLTMSDFAKVVGVTRSYIYQIAHRKQNPSVKLASKIEKSLNAKHHSIFLVTYVHKSTQVT